MKENSNPGDSARRYNILSLSAETPGSLEKLRHTLAKDLENKDDSPHTFNDICYSMNVDRGHHEYRLALVCINKKELLQRLTNGKPVEKAQPSGLKARAVFLFPGGQGDMAKTCWDFFHKGFHAVKYMDDCHKVFPLDRHPRVLVFAFQYALARLWMDLGISPSFSLGFGIGKYVSKVIANNLGLEEALEICADDGFIPTPLNTDKFKHTIEQLYSKDQRIFLEIGTGRELAALAHDVLPGKPGVYILHSYGEEDNEKILLDNIALFYSRGVSIRFSSLFSSKIHQPEENDIKILAANDPNLTLLKDGGRTANHLFLIHDATGEVDGYIQFCLELPRPVNCWGLRADWLGSDTPLDISIETIAAGYIEKIKMIQPPGHAPYSIAGWSLGGTIAFEMALQLEKMGEKMSFLGLIDSPGPRKKWRKGWEEFSLELGLDRIWKYLPDNEIKEKISNVSNIKELWTIIANHLEENNYSVEIIKKLIPGDFAQTIPNYDQMGIREFIDFLNMHRTLTLARNSYKPAKKVQTTLHYFKARGSPRTFKNCWNDYCAGSIKSHDIPGDHFSTFRKPNVEQTAKTFESTLP